MKARRTPWWCYVLAAALGLLAGMGLAKYGEISGLPLVGAPWIVPVVLAILGFVVLYMPHWCRAKRWAWQERRWPAGMVDSSS